MATRYWVGGSGTWNASSTTNWSASSGGASGASVPTLADGVIFDQVATYTVTLSGTIACLSLTVTAGVVTFSSTGSLTCYGSFTLAAGNIWTASSTLLLSGATGVITTNGVALGCNVTLISATGLYTVSYTLGSALQCLTLQLTNSTSAAAAVTLDTTTSNYALTVSALRTGGSTFVKTYKLNGSTVNIAFSNANAWNQTSGTIVDYGTSQVNFNASSNPGGTFYPQSGGTCTIYNMAFTNPAMNIPSFTGNNVSAYVFNNLTVAGNTSSGLNYLRLSGATDVTLTINGTLSIGSSSLNPSTRTYFQFYGFANNTTGRRTVNVNGSLFLQYVDLPYIAAGGSVGTWTGTSLGTNGSSTGITFTAPKTVYWSNTAGGLFQSNSYATSSGGAVSLANYPLPQDTVIFDNTGLNAASTISGAITIDTLNASALTNVTTWNFNTLTLNGNITTGSGMPTVNGSIVFTGCNAIQQLSASSTTFSGNWFSGGNPLNTGLQLQSNINIGIIYHGSGALDLNNNVLFLTQYNNNSSSDTKTIAFGTGYIALKDGGSFQNSTGTGFFATGSRDLYLVSSINAMNLSMGNVDEANALNVTVVNANANTVTFGANSAINNLNFNYTANTVALGIIPSGMKVYGSFTLSAGNTLNASTNALTFAGGTGTKTITTAGKTFDFPIVFDGYAGTFALQDAWTLAATRSITLITGTLQLKSGTTNTVPGGIITSGSAQKYLQSTIAASAATLSVASGVVAVSNITIKDSTATGGATFNANGTSTNGGNNTGWTFAASVVRQNGEFFELLF